MTNTNTVLIVILIIIVLGGGFFFYTHRAPATNPQPSSGLQVNVGGNTGGPDYTPPAQQ